jgi:hypothetical protein
MFRAVEWKTGQGEFEGRKGAPSPTNLGHRLFCIGTEKRVARQGSFGLLRAAGEPGRKQAIVHAG